MYCMGQSIYQDQDARSGTLFSNITVPRLKWARTVLHDGGTGTYKSFQKRNRAKSKNIIIFGLLFDHGDNLYYLALQFPNESIHSI